MVDWTQSPSQDRCVAGLAPEHGQPPLALAHVAPYTLEKLRCTSAVKLTWLELVPVRLFYCKLRQSVSENAVTCPMRYLQKHM